MISDGEKSQFALYAIFQALKKRGIDLEVFAKEVEIQLIAGSVRPNPRDQNDITAYVEKVIEEVLNPPRS